MYYMEAEVIAPYRPRAEGTGAFESNVKLVSFPISLLGIWLFFKLYDVKPTPARPCCLIASTAWCLFWGHELNKRDEENFAVPVCSTLKNAYWL